MLKLFPYILWGDFVKNSIIALALSALICILSVLFCTVDSVKTSAIINNDFPVIIIDAGHGGEDGGAVAIDGTFEKDINLQIALRVNEFLSVFGYKTHLIRTTDTAIHTTGDTIRERKVSDIHNRADTMNLYENCIYLSIHQNKYEDGRIWGAQTFYSDNFDESREIAQLIQKAVKSQLQPENKRQVKKSGTDIYVLYNATKPAVMVECGFVSNQNELNLLKDNAYQGKMALSIAIGIVNYNISEVYNGSEI